MLAEINQLRSDLSIQEYEVLLVSDGSGTVATRASAWCCVRHQKSDNLIDIHYGSANLGTNNFAELVPIVNTLWLDSYEKHKLPRKIVVVSDSELTVKCGNREYARNFNLMFWKSLDYLESIGYTIHWKHVPRNSNPLNSLCDKMAGSLRREIEEFQLTDNQTSDMIE